MPVGSSGLPVLRLSIVTYLAASSGVVMTGFCLSLFHCLSTDPNVMRDIGTTLGRSLDRDGTGTSCGVVSPDDAIEVLVGTGFPPSAAAQAVEPAAATSAIASTRSRIFCLSAIVVNTPYFYCVFVA